MGSKSVLNLLASTALWTFSVLSRLSLLALIVTAVQAQEFIPRLSDNSCSQGEKLLTNMVGVKIVASCESGGPMRAMHISVTNTAPEAQGKLRSVSIGFCYAEAVIGVESPTGWVADVKRRETRTDVWWTVPDASRSASPARLSALHRVLHKSQKRATSR